MQYTFPLKNCYKTQIKEIQIDFERSMRLYPPKSIVLLKMSCQLQFMIMTIYFIL